MPGTAKGHGFAPGLGMQSNPRKFRRANHLAPVRFARLSLQVSLFAATLLASTSLTPPSASEATASSLLERPARSAAGVLRPRIADGKRIILAQATGNGGNGGNG